MVDGVRIAIHFAYHGSTRIQGNMIENQDLNLEHFTWFYRVLFCKNFFH